MKETIQSCSLQAERQEVLWLSDLLQAMIGLSVCVCVQVCMCVWIARLKKSQLIQEVWFQSLGVHELSRAFSAAALQRVLSNCCCLKSKCTARGT